MRIQGNAHSNFQKDFLIPWSWVRVPPLAQGVFSFWFHSLQIEFEPAWAKFSVQTTKSGEPMAAWKDEHLCGSGGMVDTAVMQNVKRLVSLTARYANGNRYTVGSSPACRNICQGSSVKKNVRLLRGVNSKFIWIERRPGAEGRWFKSNPWHLHGGGEVV